MSELVLWHGSPKNITDPQLQMGKLHNDYGQGFYCTESLELAKEWACATPLQNGYANQYILKTDDLKILNLSDASFHILNWLAILTEHRDFHVSTVIGKEGKKYLREQFSVDLSEYDLVRGYRADDSYFSFARAFVNNSITVEQLAEAMRLGNLGEQIVLKSPNAFQRLTYVGKEFAESSVYFTKRETRSRRAEKDFLAIQQRSSLQGLYLADIIRERITNEDMRLR